MNIFPLTFSSSKIPYISQTYIFDHLRIEIGFLDDLLQQRVDEIVELCVFEPALEALGKGGTYSQGDNNIVGVLLSSVYQ